MQPIVKAMMARMAGARSRWPAVCTGVGFVCWLCWETGREDWGLNIEVLLRLFQRVLVAEV